MTRRRTTPRRALLALVAGTFVLVGCAAPAAPTSQAAGTAPTGDSTTGSAAASAVPVARADLQAPQNLSTGADCDRADAYITACVWETSHVRRFTAPGESATGGFTLASVDQYEDWGTIHSNHGPVSPLGIDSTEFASYESNGEGIENHAKYKVQEDPYDSSQLVGWYVEMPHEGTNGGNCYDSTYLMCSMTLPGQHDYQGTYHLTFFNRPLAVQIHNNVPGMTLVKQGPERVAGMLADPAATNQAASDAVLTADGTAGSNGRAFYGGYRSKDDDASFAVDYEVTDPADTAHVGSTFAIHIQVDHNNPNAASPATRCDVSGQQATVRLQCKVTVSGDNNGQSLATVEISKN